jgi:hypothetical protein
MRRLAVIALCGMLILSACRDESRESPTEPNVPEPEAHLGSCQVERFPIIQVSALILKVFPRGRLRIEALARAAAIAFLWDTCRAARAQKAAVDFVNWMNLNSARLIGTQEQRNSLINLILNGVGIMATVPTGSPGDFGVGFFDPANTNNTLVETQNGTALVELEPGSFDEPTVIVVSRRPDNSDPLNLEGNQFPPFFDYDAINNSGNHVIQSEEGAIVAFCLLNSDFETYPANRRIGHNPVAGAPGFPFEILEPVDPIPQRLLDVLDCENLAPNTESEAIPTFGLGGGLPGVADAAWRTAGHYLGPIARAVFLPQPLEAATLGTLPPPIGGRAPSLSPFGVVESSEEFGFENDEPEWEPTGFWNRSTFTDLVNTAFPTYVSTFVLDDEVKVSGGALPSPFAGSFSAWYGQASTGNYIGTQATGDADGSGGTSTLPNTGSFLSPHFRVPDVLGVELRLKTWWEIESVNPATFDIMSIEIVTGTGPTPLTELNPETDPEPTSAAQAYTSGGFDTAPVWQDVVIDLSAYRGQTVRLRFVFNTGDALYNGFRGWIVDDVRVVTGGGPSLLLELRPQQSWGGELVPADQRTFPARTQRP